eukprot:scpid63355/ scgid28322/ Protein KTI12 homolog
MPLIVLCGYPSSGKTRRATEIREKLEAAGKTVHLAGDLQCRVERNECYADSRKEKELRGALKAAAERHISKDSVVIVDSPNYIKGFRYELYCVARQHKSTQCVIYCMASVEQCREWNSSRPEDDRYSDKIFDELVMRFEEPESRNRWDSPLFSLLGDDALPMDEISEALFERKARRPNQSTQAQPVSSATFLHDVDRCTQDVNMAIMKSQQTCGPGECIPVPASNEKFRSVRQLPMAELRRLRNQFLSYTRLHPVEDAAQTATLYVQYLNNTVK